MVAEGGVPYPITIAPGALDTLGDIVRSVTPGNRPVIISDATVAREHDYARRALKSLEELDDSIVTLIFPAGERAKTRETWASLTDGLLESGCGRDTTIIALGGGVVGDLAGFIAATYMRGVPYVQVPTTLLAMVDASIGGKTGVDTRFGKNLVGAFHQPAAVVIDPGVLATLSVEHLRAGFAEIVKHGAIADADYFGRVASYVDQWPPSGRQGLEELTALIRRSVEIKSGIVARDERESGLRKVLNFGHTIGHAIEAASDFALLHGEAVAIGLVAEARLAERLGVATSGTAKNIETVCQAAGLPTAVPSIPIDVLLRFTRTDKKARQGKVEYALPKCIGEMAKGPRGWTIAVEDDRVRETLAS
jgi:3-dehydroquinate synthase